jgi:hypothetical protein
MECRQCVNFENFCSRFSLRVFVALLSLYLFSVCVRFATGAPSVCNCRRESVPDTAVAHLVAQTLCLRRQKLLSHPKSSRLLCGRLHTIYSVLTSHGQRAHPFGVWSRALQACHNPGKRQEVPLCELDIIRGYNNDNDSAAMIVHFCSASPRSTLGSPNTSKETCSNKYTGNISCLCPGHRQLDTTAKMVV